MTETKNNWNNEIEAQAGLFVPLLWSTTTSVLQSDASCLFSAAFSDWLCKAFMILTAVVAEVKYKQMFWHVGFCLKSKIAL